MKKFITKSPSSQKILKIAQMSAQLPINVIILGQAGVGKKLLAKEILQNTQSYEAKVFEKLIIDDKIHLEGLNSIILYNINQVLNKSEFLEKLDGIKIVATGFSCDEDYLDKFAVKIEILPLNERQEDLEELKQFYINEAKKIYTSNIIPKDIKIDLSKNGITLKQSIYKSILLKSITKQELIDTLNDFFIREFENQRTYKQLLEIFEIPMLKAAKTVYKSQLQMATKLGINRITLRKKLNKYFGE